MNKLKKYSKNSPSGFKSEMVFNAEDEMFLNQKINKSILNSKLEIKELSPEDVVIEQAQQDNIGAAYGALIKKDPSQAGAVLLDFAKQKYGLDDKGSEIKGARLVIFNNKIDAAVSKAYSGKKSVIDIIKKFTANNNQKDSNGLLL